MVTMEKMFAVAAMAAFLAGCGLDVKPGEDLHGAWAYAQMFVEKRLASPGTARFQPGAVAAGCARHVGNDVYEVSAWGWTRRTPSARSSALPSDAASSASILAHGGGLPARSCGGRQD